MKTKTEADSLHYLQNIKFLSVFIYSLQLSFGISAFGIVLVM